MKVQHFLDSLFLKKNKKGEYREVRIRKARHPNGPLPVIGCSHCGTPRQFSRNQSVVAFTCSSCRERNRLVNIQIGLNGD